MDSSPLPNELLILWWVIPILLVLILVRLLTAARSRAWRGEAFVRSAARRWLPEESYRALHNVTLPTLDGTTQIDHIIVSRFGIFVLETKAMTGWIFGGENQARWTQKIFHSSYRFQNPLRQNYKHIKALEAALGGPSSSIHSVVVFVGDSTFMTAMPANVTQGFEFINYIQSFRDPILSDSQVQDALAMIQAVRLPPTRKTDREHVMHLEARADPFSSRQCPRCGSAMVVRTAKRGSNAGNQFWGCSAYPRCRIVQNM